MIHALGPLVFTVVPIFFMTLSSVNDGLSHNRGFLYGIHTVIELFIIVAFIQTCHFAIPSAEIPLKARVTAVLVGLVVGKTLLVFIAEAWWSRDVDPVFPIPFSFIVASVISLPFSLYTLHRMTPKRDEPATKVQSLLLQPRRIHAVPLYRWPLGRRLSKTPDTTHVAVTLGVSLPDSRVYLQDSNYGASCDETELQAMDPAESRG